MRRSSNTIFKKYNDTGSGYVALSFTMGMFEGIMTIPLKRKWRLKKVAFLK